MSMKLANFFWTTLPLFGVYPLNVELIPYPHPKYRVNISKSIYIEIPIGHHMSLWINGKKRKITIFEESMRKNTDLIKKALSKEGKTSAPKQI